MDDTISSVLLSNLSSSKTVVQRLYVCSGLKTMSVKCRVWRLLRPTTATHHRVPRSSPHVNSAITIGNQREFFVHFAGRVVWKLHHTYWRKTFSFLRPTLKNLSLSRGLFFIFPSALNLSSDRGQFAHRSKNNWNVWEYNVICIILISFSFLHISSTQTLKNFWLCAQILALMYADKIFFRFVNFFWL